MLVDAHHFLPRLDSGLIRQVIVQYLQRESSFKGTKFIPVSFAFTLAGVIRLALSHPFLGGGVYALTVPE